MYNRYLQELTRYNLEPEAEPAQAQAQAPEEPIPVERNRPSLPERPSIPERRTIPEKTSSPLGASSHLERTPHRSKLFDFFSFDRFKKDDLLLILLLLFVFSECEDDFETLIGIGFLLLLGL